jgi:diguanylate cyclase (GGDEF)-like protein
MASRLAPTSRRAVYALLGAFLALGAPAGLIVVRAVRALQVSPSWLAAEIAADPWTYLYLLVSTVSAFALFGGTLGAQADQIAALSAVDTLTGLASRRIFEERLKHEFARARRYRLPLSLLLIDVDELKRINDREGHPAGDAALRRVARALARTLRSTDLAARWGGDEFAFLAPNASEAAARIAAERLRQELEQPSAVGEPAPPQATVSLGVATLDPASTLMDESALLAAADYALYEAKRLGRNRAAVWHPHPTPDSETKAVDRW